MDLTRSKSVKLALMQSVPSSSMTQNAEGLVFAIASGSVAPSGDVDTLSPGASGYCLGSRPLRYRRMAPIRLVLAQAVIASAIE